MKCTKGNLKILLAIVLLSVSSTCVNAQDIRYVRGQLDVLCSPDLHGRGYYKRGDRLAADHLAKEYARFGLQKFGQDYLQEYSFNVNSLEEVSVKINGNELAFGVDYMMNASSGSCSGSYKPLLVNAAMMKRPDVLFKSLNSSSKELFVILDSTGLNNRDLFRFVKGMITSGSFKLDGLIEVYSKTPGCRVGRNNLPYAYIQLGRSALPDKVNSVEVKIKNRYYDNYPTQNVIGYIPGQSKKTIVYTAHYDGMGSFGEGNYFEGASDNASGTCMVLDLAKYYSAGEKPYYTIAFMLFSGEEAGLMGSKYYADNPLLPLEDIKLVINLDMVGTGQDGVILFNGPQRPLEAGIVKKINENRSYMHNVEERNGSANSDHWPFHMKEVPAIFFLTKGRAGGGHNIFDTDETLPLYAYENLFNLVLDISKELKRQEIE